MIDRYLLRYFLAVIDCGGFSKAAKQLNVAQPTLSVGIRKLERLLGAPVFNRNSKRVQITDAGSRLAAHARRIENEFNLAEAAVANLKPVRALRLGVLSTLPNGPPIKNASNSCQGTNKNYCSGCDAVRSTRR
jgi:LysR family hydrogen peroxide-inducible transcriptional activator